MAASMVQRCLSAALKVKRFSPTLSARRCLLSAAYTNTKLWESREEDPQNLAVLAGVMDRTYDRKLPVSSLTVARFVDNISSTEEVDQAEYYLYKFRHSPNCWYLRDWTVHSWIRQCLKYGAREKALHTLKNKVQYGIFPDDFTFNILLDSYIKDGDIRGACSVVEEVMLQEAFDLPTTQILSLYALSTLLATKPELNLSDELSLGASLLLSGMKIDTTIGFSAQLMGNAMIGKVEMLKGIHAVFRGMPLIWTHGYLGRALAVMERVSAAPDVKLSKDTLEYLDNLLQELSFVSNSDSSSGEEEDRKEDVKLDEDDEEERAKLPHYANRFKELMSQLEVQGKVEASTLQVLASGLTQQHLAAAEVSDLQEYQRKVEEWEAERRQLIQREKEMKEISDREREEREAARAAAQKVWTEFMQGRQNLHQAT